MGYWDSIFRPAQSKNRSWNLLKTFFQTSIFWITFLIIIPHFIQLLESNLEIPNFKELTLLGGVFFVMFSLFGLYSGYTMSWYGKGTPLPNDCPRELVVSGPYKLVRNPLAVAGIGQGICVGLILGSFGVVLYALSGAIFWHLFVRPAEESDMEKRFGATYLEYKRSVKCWIPRFGN